MMGFAVLILGSSLLLLYFGNRQFLAESTYYYYPEASAFAGELAFLLPPLDFLHAICFLVPLLLGGWVWGGWAGRRILHERKDATASGSFACFLTLYLSLFMFTFLPILLQKMRLISDDAAASTTTPDNNLMIQLLASALLTIFFGPVYGKVTVWLATKMGDFPDRSV